MNVRLENLWKIITHWKFLLSVQSLLIFFLYIIGNIRSFEENSGIFLSRIPGAIFNFVVTILGFPSGIYFLFTTDTKLANTWLHGAFIANVVPVIYYFLFIIGMIYIAKKKKYYRTLALIFLIFMLLSFVGCSRVIELPLIIT